MSIKPYFWPENTYDIKTNKLETTTELNKLETPNELDKPDKLETFLSTLKVP